MPQDVIKAQDQQGSGRDLHEQFHHQLERSADGFSVVADYFGRGVFNKVYIGLLGLIQMANVIYNYQNVPNNHCVFKRVYVVYILLSCLNGEFPSGSCQVPKLNKVCSLPDLASCAEIVPSPIRPLPICPHDCDLR